VPVDLGEEGREQEVVGSSGAAAAVPDILVRVVAEAAVGPGCEAGAARSREGDQTSEPEGSCVGRICYQEQGRGRGQW
jgi:hypothetical protein